ncbi:hypothetical protein SRIMM317S_02719 [Streptomyces rimosus subsp. rimosus]
MYGREAAGHSSTIATHQPPDTTIASPPSSSWTMRRRSAVGAQTAYTTASGGRISHACNVLVRKAKPKQTPASSSHFVRASSSARSTQYTAHTMSRQSSASGLLKRNISAATGVSASSAPANSPAPAPNRRRTAAYSTPTVATPISASGTRIAHALRPKSRTDRAIGHRAAGGLSTVMEFAASDDPKKNAVQLAEPAWAAAE